jgi:phosphoribosyl 1,2-cyclic phosphodiesterase
MSKAEINAGVCGHVTTVEARMEGKICRLAITSDCKAIQELAKELMEVNPMLEISCKRATPQTLQMGLKHCYHAACPVPVGIIKAIEVEARLALPKDVLIKVAKD